MKLAEIYANHCGIKLPEFSTKPFRSYFPIIGDYITIHNGSGMESKNYDYYAEVLEILNKRLVGVKFVQIGSTSEQLLPHCDDLRGQTSLSQCNYVIENSLLHIGNDSVWVHIAGMLNIPSVSLYGPTLPQSCEPFYKNEKSISLDSHRGGGRASHSTEEFPKTVNYIKPEEVANAALEILGLPKSKQETIHIGQNYKNPIVEVIPDAELQNGQFQQIMINIRLDLGGVEEIVPIISHGRTVTLTTDKRLDMEILQRIKPSLEMVLYKVEDELDMGFVEALSQSGLDYSVVTENEDLFTDLKFQLLNFKPPRKIVRPKPIEGDFKNCMVKSSKILCSGGKFYLSEYHLDAKLPLNLLSENFGPVPDTIEESFWKDSNNYYIFKP